MMPSSSPSTPLRAVALIVLFAASRSLSTPPPTVRILCFGDSLTAGSIDMDGSGGLFPYATHLKAALEEQAPESTWQVGHLGMPGWTAEQMVQTADDPVRGLRHRLKQVQNPSLSLVVILAGTNDLGYWYESPVEDAAAGILQSITALHIMAHERNVASLAVGIPTSRSQQQVSPLRELRLRVNERLGEWAEASSASRASYTPFPSSVVPDPQINPKEDEFWSEDGLHLTAKGYAAMGRALAGNVRRALLQKEETKHSWDL